MLKKPQVSIIIVNWNGKKHLHTCLTSLYKSGIREVETIVVDNASTDASQELVLSLKKKYRRLAIELIPLTYNAGYAQGNNIGYDKSRGDYILFLNNDTFVSVNFLQPLLQKIKENSSRIAAVQPLILQHPRRNLIDSIGSYFISSGFLYHLGHNKKINNTSKAAAQIYSLKGACMLFQKRVLKKIGVFDESYFAYFEETDLCHRAWLAGYELWFDPNSAIYHKGGETSNKMQTSYVTYHSYKNRIRTYLKNFEPGTLLVVLPVHLMYCFTVCLAYLFTGKFSLCIAIIRAIGWNILSLASLRSERRNINRLRKKTDKNYLKHITKKVRLSYYYHLFTTALAGYADS